MPTEEELEQRLLENLGLISKDEQNKTNDNKQKQKEGETE